MEIFIKEILLSHGMYGSHTANNTFTYLFIITIIIYSAVKFKNSVQKKAQSFSTLLKEGNKNVTASMCLMGLGQMMYKQWGKGILYLLVQIAYILYLVLTGAADLFGFFTLGSAEANPWYGVEGDNSVIMLIMGVLAFIVTIIYIVLYVSGCVRAISAAVLSSIPYLMIPYLRMPQYGLILLP